MCLSHMSILEFKYLLHSGSRRWKELTGHVVFASSEIWAKWGVPDCQLICWTHFTEKYTLVSHKQVIKIDYFLRMRYENDLFLWEVPFLKKENEAWRHCVTCVHTASCRMGRGPVVCDRGPVLLLRLPFASAHSAATFLTHFSLQGADGRKAVSSFPLLNWWNAFTN